MLKKQNKIPISLTKKQGNLMWWALNAGLEQHCKLLHHDGWDADLTKNERSDLLWAKRQFVKAIKLFEKKIGEKLIR